MSDSEKQPAEGCFNLLMLITGAFLLWLIFVAPSDDKNHDLSPKEARLETIKKGFSADGSHTRATLFLKEKLRDPGSYEHIKTTVFDKGDHLIVITQFRSRNGFGGMTRQTLKVKAGLHGNVVKILGLEQE